MTVYLLVIGIAAGLAGDPVAQYEFVRDTKPNVALQHGDVWSIGKLDAAGNFLPDPQWMNLRVMLSSSPGGRLINPGGYIGSVYEYRSGRLILGKLDDKGNFIPELGGKVIALSEYLSKYRPGKSPKVYNLPGRIVKRGSKDEDRK